VLEIESKLLLNRLKPVRDAAHDAFGHSPACLKGTRADVLAGIGKWMQDPSSQPLYWLTGVAGSGKSTISQSVAIMAEQQKYLAASFFFLRAATERQRDVAVIPTITYQLSRRFPMFRPRVCAAISSESDIRTMELAKQADILLSSALSNVSHEFPRPLIIVLDALDECNPNATTNREGGDLVPALLRIIQGLPFCVKVFITSRPESSFEVMCASKNIALCTARLALHRDVKEEDIRDGITLYLRDELEKLALERDISFPFPPLSSMLFITKCSPKRMTPSGGVSLQVSSSMMCCRVLCFSNRA
jgi:cytidylate kinase